VRHPPLWMLGVMLMAASLPSALPAAENAPAPPAAPASAPAPAPTPAPSKLDLSRPEIQSFIAERANEGMSTAKVTAILARAESQPRIIEIMTRPAEQALLWHEYRSRFITDERINAGVKLWQEHRDLLDGVAREYGVSPQFILAIVGVETFYGRITGRYRVLDALSTLAFDYPPRSTFFRSELAQFLKMIDEEKLDATTPLGSYAGAMGVTQFMPSSFRKYAVNIDGPASRDLWRDWGDIFGSIANYLHQFGWAYGDTVLAEASFTGGTVPELPAALSLKENLGALKQQGFSTDYGAADDTPAFAIGAQLADRMSYRIGFKNFYVITRYNGSRLYAMAVSDLADALDTRFYQ
jgi:membrane-bound lytic murein transglycosylase B